MKKTIPPFLLLLLICFHSSAQGDMMPVVIDNLSIRGDMAYYQGQPFTGIGYTMLTGKKTLEIIYRNGYKDGNHTEWYTNGKKKVDYQYSHGKMLDGVYKTCDEAGGIKKNETYKNGTIAKEENYKAGKKNGPTREYYTNGNLKSESNYLNDQPDGKAVFYHDDNSVCNEEQYQQGKHISGTAYDNAHHIILKTIYDSGGNSIISTAKYSYNTDGSQLSELYYDANQQLDGICYEKWDNGTIKWKRKYNHGQIEQTIEENKTDPSKSIKAVFAKNHNALVGVAKAISANALNADHMNFQVIYQLNDNIYSKESLISSTNNWLFNYRLKYVDPSSPEVLDGAIIIKNYHSTYKYIQPQNYGYVNIPGGYKVTVYLDVLFKSMHDGIPDETQTVSWESKKVNSIAEGEAGAGKEVGSKIADILYAQFPIRCKVIAVKDARNNGLAKSVIIDAGSDLGIYHKGKMKVFDVTDPLQAGGNVIANLEATQDITADRTVCKVISGEDKLTELLKSGKSYKVVF